MESQLESRHKSRTLLMLVFIFIFFCTFAAGAATFTSNVVRVSEGKNTSEKSLIYLSHDGLIAKVDAKNADLLAKLKTSSLNGSAVEVTMDENHFVSKVRTLTNPPTTPPVYASDMGKKSFDLHYAPTVLNSYADAEEIFYDLNTNYQKRSECYNRAEVWTYEQFQRRGLYSQKVFLFFTERYIREYDYGWWFHVSPFVLVAEGGGASEYVIDRTFTEKPMGMKDWTDNFIYPQTYCPQVYTYSGYSQHQEEAYCYLIKEPMYFWQPRDVEQNEIDGSAKTSFQSFDVNTAYEQGF